MYSLPCLFSFSRFVLQRRPVVAFYIIYSSAVYTVYSIDYAANDLKV